MSSPILASERVYGARYRIIGPLERAAESLWLADDMEQSRRCIVQLVTSWGGSSVRPESWRRLSEPERVDSQERLAAAVRREVERRAFRHPAVLQPMQVIPDIFAPDEPEHSGVPVAIVCGFNRRGASLLSLSDTWNSLVRQVLAETLEALAAMHAAERVHAALSPETIFVISNPKGHFEPRIGGLFCQPKPSTASGEWVHGAAVYRAPEQLEAAGVVGAAADLWSFGLLATRVLTGRLPYAQSGSGSGMSRPRGLSVHSPDLSRVEPSLREAIRGCLDPDPKNRPNASELVGIFAGVMPTLVDAKPDAIGDADAAPSLTFGAAVTQTDPDAKKRPGATAERHNHASSDAHRAGREPKPVAPAPEPDGSTDDRKNTAGLFIAEDAATTWPPPRASRSAAAQPMEGSILWAVSVMVILVFGVGWWLFSSPEVETTPESTSTTLAAGQARTAPAGAIVRSDTAAQGGKSLSSADTPKTRQAGRSANTWTASMPAMRCEGEAIRSVRGSVKLLKLPCEVACVMAVDHRGWPSELLGCKSPSGLRTVSRKLKLSCMESSKTSGVICSTHVVFQLPGNEPEIVDRIELRFDGDSP